MKKLTLIVTAAAFFALGWFTKPDTKILFNDGVLRGYVIKEKTLESQHAQNMKWSYPRIDIKFGSDSIHFYTDESTFNRHKTGDTVELLIIRTIVEK